MLISQQPIGKGVSCHNEFTVDNNLDDFKQETTYMDYDYKFGFSVVTQMEIKSGLK